MYFKTANKYCKSKFRELIDTVNAHLVVLCQSFCRANTEKAKSFYWKLNSFSGRKFFTISTKFVIPIRETVDHGLRAMREKKRSKRSEPRISTDKVLIRPINYAPLIVTSQLSFLAFAICFTNDSRIYYFYPCAAGASQTFKSHALNRPDSG